MTQQPLIEPCKTQKENKFEAFFYHLLEWTTENLNLWKTMSLKSREIFEVEYASLNDWLSSYLITTKIRFSYTFKYRKFIFR